MNRPQVKIKISKIYFYNFLLLAIFALILKIPYFDELNLLFVDKLQGNIAPRKEIVIVGVDDKSLQELGAWPWNRDIFAKALTNLAKTNPQVVGIDVLFLEQRPNDESFDITLNNTNFPLILASKLIDDTVIESKFNGKNTSNGFINLYSDHDGKIRRTLKATTLNGICYNSFSFALTQKYLNRSNQPNCIGTELSFNYSNNAFKTISFVDVFNNKVTPQDFTGKIVLIGSTALDLRSNLNDNFIDVLGNRISGIEVHANIINSFLENRFQTPLTNKILYSLVFGLSTTLFIVYKTFKNDKLELALFALMLLVMDFVGFVIYDFGINWPFVQTNILLLTSFVFLIAYKYLIENKEKKFIQRAFSQYVSPNVLRKIIAKPEELNLGGDRRTMTVLFSDIRGFTTISEQLSAEELTHMLNSYLDMMCDVILAFGGTVDKFMGDAVMAFWNAPLDDAKHQLNGVLAALKMTEQLETFRKNYAKYGELNMGIGINTGEMVVGNMGSKRRFDYTVLGDNVNLGSRLESLTKKYGVSIIVAETVTSNAEFAKNEVFFRLLDEVIVKGKAKPVKIYQPLVKTVETIKLKESYETAFSHYQKGKFEQALRLFNKLENDNPSRKLIDRINEIKDTANWNGIWTWLEK